MLGHETYPQRTAAAPAPRCRARREAARWLFWCHTRGNVHDGLKRRFRPSPLPSRVFPHLDHDTRQRTARRGTQDNPAASSPARRLPRQVPGSNARQCSLSRRPNAWRETASHGPCTACGDTGEGIGVPAVLSGPGAPSPIRKRCENSGAVHFKRVTVTTMAGCLSICASSRFR